jgi:outer membrane receptor protein involved in Fe transport
MVEEAASGEFECGGTGRMSEPSIPARCVGVLAGLAAATLLAGPAQAVAEADDITELSLEELLKIRVIQTPKFSINAALTPSAVSVLTRGDIRAYGWRTLADALRTLNGYTVSNDHTYSLVGVRGISAPGDYRSRLQLLIDGIPVNENVYGSANFDNAFPLDIDLIEQIEVVRGPSASVYGGDSTFGVINVVTRNGGNLDGAEISASRASGNASAGRVSWGKLTEGGADVLLSYTAGHVGGRGLVFPDLAAAGLDTGAQEVGGERAGKFFARFKTDHWRATLIHSARDETIPTGSYGTLFNDNRHREADAYTLAELAGDQKLSQGNSLHSRVYAGQYTYKGDFPYDYPPYVLNRDRATGQWWGLESRVLSTAWQGHRWIGGIEFKENRRQDQRNEDVGYGCFGFSGAPCLDDRRRSRQGSVFAQDELVIADATYLTLGLRYDKLTEMPGHWSPRVGLVRQNDHGGTFKLLYATAFSDPSVYQRYYLPPTYAVGNPDLKPERMKSLDIAWEQRLGQRSAVTASLYAFRIKDMLGIDGTTGLSGNLPEVTARGAEFEFQHRWRNRAAVRVGYTRQQPTIVSGYLENMPRDVLRGNLAAPILDSQWLAGVEGQLVSRRLTGDSGNRVAGYAVVNANLGYEPSARNWDVALSIHNLFDHRYDDPVALDTTVAGLRDRLPQLGRGLRFKFTARF